MCQGERVNIPVQRPERVRHHDVQVEDARVYEETEAGEGQLESGVRPQPLPQTLSKEVGVHIQLVCQRHVGADGAVRERPDTCALKPLPDVSDLRLIVEPQ